jgi:hypothetical protein
VNQVVDIPSHHLHEVLPFLNASMVIKRYAMNDNLPHIELPESATLSDSLAHAIDVSREAISVRLGYEVEVASLEPVDREGHANLRVYWRRKPPDLHVVS